MLCDLNVDTPRFRGVCYGLVALRDLVFGV